MKSEKKYPNLVPHPATKEQMVAVTAARLAKQAHRKTLDLLDESYFCRTREWEEAAESLGLTLPPWSRPITVTELRGWLRKVHITVEEFLGWLALSDLSAFARLNPRWPMRALAGIIVEGKVRGDVPIGRELTLAEWVDYASANGIDTPPLGRG